SSPPIAARFPPSLHDALPISRQVTLPYAKLLVGNLAVEPPRRQVRARRGYTPTSNVDEMSEAVIPAAVGDDEVTTRHPDDRPGDDAETLPLTGERTVPGIAEENYWFRRHEVVYARLLARCAGKTVLEAGSGEGYGADMIAGVAAKVTGVDYDDSAVAHVRARYPRV